MVRSFMKYTNVPTSLMSLIRNMEKQLQLVRYLPKTCHLGIKLASNETKGFELMQIFVETGANDLHPLLIALSSQGLVRSSSMPITLFLGLPNYKMFEDDASALELALLPKLWPHTKDINVCYHDFCEYVHHGKTKTFPISTDDQSSKLFTKAWTQNIFFKPCTHMHGQ